MGEELRAACHGTLVIVGLTTNHCVSTTARMAGNLGFDTWVVSDATATFDRVGPDGLRYPAEQIHAIALSDLHGEFATVVDTESLLSRRVGHPEAPGRPLTTRARGCTCAVDLVFTPCLKHSVVLPWTLRGAGVLD